MKPATFRLELHPDTGRGVTVVVIDADEFDPATGQPNQTVLWSTTVNVCDESDGQRRALADAARFIAWYMDPR